MARLRGPSRNWSDQRADLALDDPSGRKPLILDDQ
jgi:hypothetical protein